MTFFNDNVATVLQYFTFPLEVVGFTLAFIEIRHPVLTNKMSGWIQLIVEKIRVFFATGEDRRADELEALTGKKIDDLMSANKRLVLFLHSIRIVTPWLVFAVVMLYLPTIGNFLLQIEVNQLTAGEQLELASRYSLIRAAIGGMVFLGVVSFLFVTFTLGFSQSFVEGRVVGTLGLVLASLGVLGEAYQFTTQLIL